MAIIKYNTKEKELLARLMRAEALGEGNLGMLMVGNVIINRTIADCLTFKNVNTITDVVFQNPGGFSGINSPLFYSNPTSKELDLAYKILRGEKYKPANCSLWFYSSGNTDCSSTWWDQNLAGKYKNHCFYQPNKDICTQLY